MIKRDERVLDFLNTRHNQIDNPTVFWIDSHTSAHWPQLVHFVSMGFTMRCCVCNATCRIR